MNFANLNDIREHLESFKRTPKYTPDSSKNSDENFFGRLTINSFHLDIMAGVRALCEPRVFYDDILHYKKIQVSINETIRDLEHAVQPGADDRFKGFGWLKYFTYTNNKGLVKTSYMGDMMPIDIFIPLIRDVYKISRLKIFF